MTPSPELVQLDKDVPELRSLGPEYDEKLHGRHAGVLLRVLSDTSDSAPKNIALAGHYGSGKSSVILGVQKGLSANNVKWVNLSLSSLGIDDTKRARVQEDGTLAPLTNLIQKEIVKQLLYRKSPRDMPGSRYFRIDAFRAGRAAQWAAATAIGVFAVGVLLGLVGRVRKVAPVWLAQGPGWAPWATVALLGVFMGVVCFLALRGLQNPVKVDSVSAGGAAVSLSAKENSYFDEYLDEIVYFFQQTKTTVAIFEDLDRFKDPHIFETLRELNTVLNSSEQVKAQPVRFVYAVRDSIFEQLNIDSVPGADAGAESPSQDAVRDRLSRGTQDALRAAAQESIPSANRTKFFDMVVPMVPFLTHRSARDLLAAEFDNAPEKPSTALVNLVGAHQQLTDMRLILNIRNEFEIYRPSVLGNDGLEGLTTDRLFAMMVYKNTHLEDFEAIRHGTSQIDAAYRAFRDMVEHQVIHQAARSRSALARANGVKPWDDAARAVGERLAQVLRVLHRMNGRGGRAEPSLFASTGTYAMSDLGSGELWRKLHEDRESVQVGHVHYGMTTVTFDELLLLAGEAGLALEDSVQSDVSELRRRSRTALATKGFVTQASLAQLMARTDITMPDAGGQERSLDEIVSTKVTPLARDLLVHGYIDENYTLYCSDYHGVAISVSAMNFILHSVQGGQSYPLFRFDDPTSIDAVEKEMGDRFLGSDSVFNVQVFDHYLMTKPALLDGALGRLAVLATAGETSFLDLFFQDDAVTTKTDLASGLVTRWPGLLTHLIAQTPTDLAPSLVDAALRGARDDTNFEATDGVSKFIENNYSAMGVFTEEIEADASARLAKLVKALGVRIPGLGSLGGTQRSAIVAAGLYPATRANLLAALGKEASLALDAVKDENGDVYRHVVANLPDYLNALNKAEVTIDDASRFEEILNDLVESPDESIRLTAERASETCAVQDIGDVDEGTWSSVVAADRLHPSVANVGRYVAKHGVTEPMANMLKRHGLTEPDGEAEGEAAEERIALAYAILETDRLDAQTRVRLIVQVRTSAYLDLDEFSADDLLLVPALLAAGEVKDVAETYAFLSDHPYTLREDYFAASEELPSYVTTLALSSTDLTAMIKSRRVASDVKRTITADVDFVAARLSQTGAIAICEWASMGNEVSQELLLALSSAGAPADRILELLEPLLPTIDTDVLDGILRGLGDEFEPLTRTGHHRPKVKARSGTDELLAELQKRGRVSSYTQLPVIRKFSVNMRR